MDRQTCTFLTGFEPFTISSHPSGFALIDFWQFQFSNIWDLQDQIAEFIVAQALEIKEPHNKNGWTLWDITYKGMRVEVKETAYYHSWRTDGNYSTQRSFSITKAFSRYKDSTSEYCRQNDIYVFCLNTGKTKEESNPLDLDHWRFWVVPTETINHACGNNKTITLSRLQKITGLKDGIGYEQLRAAVDNNCK